MNNILKSIKNLPKKGQRNGVRILCLALGLAIGSILIAKVWFEQSYDKFWGDSDRIYRINEKVNMNGVWGEYGQTSGGVAPTLKRYSPIIETATRYTFGAYDDVIEKEDKTKVRCEKLGFADSCFFDVFDLKIISGDPHKVLAEKGYCMISESMAKKLGGSPLGTQISCPSIGGHLETVGGIYRDIPANSILANIDVIIALPNIGKYMYDGSEGLWSNDRYISFIKIAEGTDSDLLREDIDKMIKQNLPIEELKASGIELDFNIIPITDTYSGTENVKRMSWILSLLAFVLLLCAVMNYLLVVVSQVVSRSKEMAVHKCYGAGKMEIFKMVFAESLVHLIVSIILAFAIVMAMQSKITDLIGSDITALVSPESISILGGICLAILALTTIVPAILYFNIPVSSAFRNYKENKKLWKRSLLAVQIALAGFLICLVVLIGRQYSRLVNDDLGYNADNLAYISLSGTSFKSRGTAVEELRNLSGVVSTTTSTCLFFEGVSGDLVELPGDETQYHITNLYFASPNFFETMEIPIVQGTTFTSEYGDTTNCQVMVERKFVEMMKAAVGWDDNVIGKRFRCTSVIDGNPLYTIVGVFDNLQLNSLAEKDSRDPALIFNGGRHAFSNILIRYDTISKENIQKTQEVLDRLYPDRINEIKVYKNEIIDQYNESRRFRDSVFIGGLVTVLVALLGLIGYANDEVVRRRREIAIRKVNGAKVKRIYKMFVYDILKIALPSLIVGATAAALVGTEWLKQFSEKVSLGIPVFALCIIVLLAILIATITYRILKVARENPADNIKAE